MPQPEPGQLLALAQLTENTGIFSEAADARGLGLQRRCRRTCHIGDIILTHLKKFVINVGQKSVPGNQMILAGAAGIKRSSSLDPTGINASAKGGWW
jgi:hypothetical protein